MSGLFAAFGIDWRLLVINFINFGALLWVLWYFLYTPLTNMLEKRREMFAQGVRDAADAAARLQEVEDARGSMLAEAGKEADAIVASARTAGITKEKELRMAGEETAAQLVREAEAQAQELKLQAITESKQEVAKLIVLGMERLAQKN